MLCQQFSRKNFDNSLKFVENRLFSRLIDWLIPFLWSTGRQNSFSRLIGQQNSNYAHCMTIYVMSVIELKPSVVNLRATLPERYSRPKSSSAAGVP